MVIIMLTYATIEFMTLQRNEGSIISSHNVLNHFDKDYEFDSDKLGNGFQVAFGFTAYDDNYEMLHDPQYGELKAVRKAWSGDEFTEYKEIQFRPCTDEELGLG